jgi:hypothetical protein
VRLASASASYDDRDVSAEFSKLLQLLKEFRVYVIGFRPISASTLTCEVCCSEVFSEVHVSVLLCFCLRMNLAVFPVGLAEHLFEAVSAEVFRELLASCRCGYDFERVQELLL